MKNIILLCYYSLKMSLNKNSLDSSVVSRINSNNYAPKRNCYKNYAEMRPNCYKNYGNPGCKLAVWKKAKKIKDLNPEEYRLCKISGNIIRYSHYGNNKSPNNWDIDHIIPKNKNGSDDLSNLQPISSSKNRSMRDSLKEKPEIIEKMFEAMCHNRGISNERNHDFKWNINIIGQSFWVKATPITTPQIAIIKSYDKQFVKVFWEDARFETNLPLDKNLFEKIPEGRPKRSIKIK